MSKAPALPSASPDPAFDGDLRWRARRRLRDGTLVVIRPLVPEDRAELSRAFERLSDESRRARFFTLGVKLTDELLDYLTNVDQRDHVALVAELASGVGDRGVGVARLIRLAPGASAAELGLAVADAMQRRGVGAILLSEIVRTARTIGVRTVRAEVLASNRAMRRVLERAGARVVESDDAQTTVYELAVANENEAQRSASRAVRRDECRSATFPVHAGRARDRSA